MLRILEDYLSQLAERHADIEESLRGLGPEALDWLPGPQLNSLAVLATHTAGAERYWIGHVALGEPSDRDREAEFHVRGVGPDVLLGKLRDNLEYARGALGRLAVADLDTVRAAREGREVTVFWALAHALEHTALHAGHMQITRQLWDERGA